MAWGSHHTFGPSMINFGKAAFSDNRLTLQPEIGKEHLNFLSVPIEMVPVKWGEQHFLIPSDKLLHFAYAVHSGAGSQIVEYFVKSRDIQKPRAGLPNLPKEYTPVMTMKAIKPKITAIITDEKSPAYNNKTVVLNMGSDAKIIEGMAFYYENSSGSLRVTVTELKEKTSKARVSGIASNNGKEIELKIGMKFTSKVPSGALDLP